MKVKSDWAEGRATITHRHGFHLSAITIFAELANQFNARIMVCVPERPDGKRNGKRIIELITLGASKGTDLLISAEGDDARPAVITLLHLLREDFKLTV